MTSSRSGRQHRMHNLKHIFLWVLLFIFAVVAKIESPALAQTRCRIDVGMFGYAGDLSDLEGGYCVLGGWYIPGLVTKSFYYTPPPQHFITRALYQSEHLLEESASLHGYSGDEDYVALLSPSTAGWKAFVRIVGTADYVPVRVVDSVRREHMAYALYTRSGVELSYALAERLGAIEWQNADGSRYPDTEICIADANPEAVCATEATDFYRWMLTNIRFVGDLNWNEAMARRDHD